MLHDLLTALKGCGGDMFVWKDNYTFQISNDLGLLHPCEVAIIEEAMNVAGYYKKLTLFCDSHDIVRVNADDGKQCGVYLCSLAWSVRRATQHFLNNVVDIEERLLTNPSLPLTVVLASLKPLAPTLAVLATMVQEIEDEKVEGCKILEVLHKYATNTVAQVQEVMKRVEQEVHSVLYDQLSHWLLHGLLLDPHHEFFITKTTNKEANEIKQMASLSLEEDNVSDLGIGEEVSLKAELVPSHIPLSVASKILFVGNAILVFQQQGSRDIGEGGVWEGREGELEDLLRGLNERDSFSLSCLTQAIDTITNCVSQALWEVVMGAGLIGVLGELKGVYLLGRGELFQALLPTLGPYLTHHASPTTSNLNGLLQAAGRQVLVEDTFLEKFTLTFTPPAPSNTINSTTNSAPLVSSHSTVEKTDSVWNQLEVEYQARWPLHCLFSPTAQDKYNAIFRFLLRVRRAQHRLQQLWMTQMRSSKHREGGGGCLQWTLRHHMTLLIDNIQYYLQVDVLESEHWKLVEAVVNGGKNYKKLSFAHSAFLSTVAARCFLHHPVLSTTLSKLLALVHKFCAIVEADGTVGISGKQLVRPQQTKEGKKQDLAFSLSAKEMQDVRAELERIAAHLFFVLSKLQLNQGTQHTAQLIMRMDYNRYYSKNDTMKRFRARGEDEGELR
ncbi:hypothetical protein Pmani_031002 [Petrolisthes manimaculis]|uniref:Gamma-tubulin complex component n=1 Tax=Petrolisthes manimaculis TaxID=1843537 RepID=A0AAE1NWL8_9EUCA|nr:hypothetical protein Pmani_031002 [Petrolisthes manimaculis]